MDGAPVPAPDGRKPGDQGSGEDTGTVLVERVPAGDGQCAALITLNRPDQLNAFDGAMLAMFQEALGRASQDPAVRGVLITGRGRAFSVGGDIKNFASLQADPVGFPRFVDAFIHALTTIRTMDKPVLALVNGVCVGGGLELLVACDFAWAAQSAQIGDAHLNYAQVGGAGAMSLLPRLIGPARARELVLSARLLSAVEAFEWGLVNRVLPDEVLVETGIELVRGLAAKSAAAVRSARHLINTSITTDLEGALRLERTSALLHCLTLPDSMEGVTAFIEKRAPRWPAG